MLPAVKEAIYKIDQALLNGAAKSYYYRNFAFKSKAYHLTKEIYFPPHTDSNKNIPFGPYGELLAVGGDLSPERLIHAFKNGITQSSNQDEPLLWWTADIRCVFFPQKVHISKKMNEVIRSNKFHLSIDKCFDEVLDGCSEGRVSTWLTPERKSATNKLYQAGVAHSVEVWQNGKLVGGLFGVAFGSYFYVESMFTRVNHTSKLALIALVLRLGEMGFPIVDFGIWPTDHAMSLGAEIISRDEFFKILESALETPKSFENWNDLFADWDLKAAANQHLAVSKAV